MKRQKSDNRGFTLIEALLCIAVLGILIAPLLGSFVTAAKVNAVGKKNQKATVLAGNIMESIKSITLEETALEFNNAEVFQIIDSNLNGSPNSNYRLKEYSVGGYGEYYSYGSGAYKKITPSTEPRSSVLPASESGDTPGYVFSPPDNRKSFIFGIENLFDGETAFDVLVTLDTAVYGDRIKYEDSMNNYKMPDLAELNENTVAILDLEGINTTWSDDSENAEPIRHISTDDQAISDFYNIYLAHQALEDIKTEETQKSPAAGMDEIKAEVTKTIEIYLTKDDSLGQAAVNCSITYRCGLDLDEDGEPEELPRIDVSSGNYPLITKGETQCQVYLFYTPSEFTGRDSIILHNDGVDAEITIASQNEEANSRVTIRKEENHNPVTKIDTNLKNNQMDVDFPVNNDGLVVKKEDTNRVYTMTVAVYPAGTIGSGKLEKAYAVLTSAREE